MSGRNFVVGLPCQQLLQEAAQKNLPLTLTNQSGQNWQVFKANFLSFRANRLIVSLPVPDMAHCHLEPAPGQEVAVTFKKGYSKCLFTTRVINQERYEIEPGLSVPAMVLLRPEQIEKIQRRAYYRAPVPPGEPVRVTLWQVDSNQQKGESYRGRLLDLSAGGAGVLLRNREADQWERGDQFEMQFVPLPGHEPLQLQVQFCHATKSSETNQFTAGFKLVGLEMSEQGRNTLRQIGRITNVYQRRRPVASHPDLACNSS